MQVCILPTFPSFPSSHSAHLPILPISPSYSPFHPTHLPIMPISPSCPSPHPAHLPILPISPSCPCPPLALSISPSKMGEAAHWESLALSAIYFLNRTHKGVFVGENLTQNTDVTPTSSSLEWRLPGGCFSSWKNFLAPHLEQEMLCLSPQSLENPCQP